MQTKEFKTASNDFARFLGLTVKRLENEMKTFSPLTKCFTWEEKKQFQAEPPLPMPQQAVVPSISSHNISQAHIVEKKLVESLKNIQYDNRVEEIKSEVLLSDMQSSERLVRMQALGEVKKLSQPTAIRLLEGQLSRERDTLKIIELLNVLSNLGNQKLVPKHIFKNYVSHEDSSVRLAALRVISKYQDEETFNILSECMKDKDAEVRRQALNCLCWTFQKRCLSHALNALHDVEPRVRKVASQITGVVKAHQAISSLITLLSDPDKQVQGSANIALKKITGQDFEFKVSAANKNKEEAIECWRYWWRDNQTKFIRLKQ